MDGRLGKGRDRTLPLGRQLKLCTGSSLLLWKSALPTVLCPLVKCLDEARLCHTSALGTESHTLLATVGEGDSPKGKWRMDSDWLPKFHKRRASLGST